MPSKVCPECNKTVSDAQAEPHAVMHWGEDLGEACKRNPDAKARIRELTGKDY